MFSYLSDKLGPGYGGPTFPASAPSSKQHGNRLSLPRTARKPGHLGSYYLLFHPEWE